MLELPAPITELTKLFARLPGVGRRSAQRFAFHILDMKAEDINALAAAIQNAQKELTHCGICGALTTHSPCSICIDPKRDEGIVCVVSEAKDIFAMEKSQEFSGKYHVLGGSLSPINNIGPDDLNIEPLIKRVEGGGLREIMFATNPDVEGEATAAYIAKLLKPYGVRVTRLAHGIPMGGNLEYVDSVTLSLAVEGRREI